MMLRDFSILSLAWPVRRQRAKAALRAIGTLAALTLVSGAALAQTNAPLTGSPAAPPAGTAPAPAPADSSLAARPVVRQVSTPMPVSAADTAAPPQGPAFAAPRPSAAPAPVDEGPTGTGGITRALLTAQGDGRRAAPAQPTLGVVATAAFDRYLDSFKLPIPQWFQQRVQTDESQ
ncbi:DUF3613 domain-containing protein [Bordetella sp. LUAb4]|uniref:DUF3613 domain-containing protein n=1 Tax=Bordetella sp. LUAb4 TaxID=2843195 RepID=UPI001E4A604F|nr:DUF3613 domain-containing protein [Bordetella sp. LUAb4]